MFNFIPFFLAVFTISGVIFVSMAILVFMGWKLNILESVAITLAIGLSVDFTLHYAMMFKKGNNCEDQESAVIYSVTKMGGPVSMAAFTTIIPGLCMLPSRYVKINLPKFHFIESLGHTALLKNLIFCANSARSKR